MKLEFRCNPKKALWKSDDSFKGIANDNDDDDDDDDDDDAIGELELDLNQLLDKNQSQHLTT